MMYEIQMEGDVFFVVEKKTNQVMIRTKNKNLAYRYNNQLNSGTGFQGKTPNFFLQNTENKE